MSEPRDTLATRCYRLALALLPAPLRSRHGAEALQLFRRLEARERARRGAAGAWLLLARAVGDVVRQAPGAHRFEARTLARRSRSPRRTAMTTLRHDLTLALRLLARQPLFTVVAALTLALGLGANTAIFSAVYGVLLRPLGVRDADTLAVVALHRASDRNDVTGFHPAHLEDLRSRLAGRSEVEGLTAFVYESATLMEDGRPEEIGSVLHVGPGFFRTVGFRQLVGRGLVPEDARSGLGAVAVIDETLWRERFGADPAIVGRRLVLDGRPVTVVGVVAAEAPVPDRGQRIWLPRAWDLEDPTLIGRLAVLARISPDAGLHGAEQALRAALTEIEPEHPRFQGYTASLVGFRESVVGDVRPALVLATGAAGLILLVACANMASLLLARASARDREMATRRAVGARLPQLVRQLLVESLALACLGGLLALAVAAALHRLLLALAPAGLPRIDAIRLDLPVLAFAGVSTLVAGVLFGLAPLAHVLGSEVPRASGADRSRHRGGGRLRAALVVGQVAIAVALLVGAALMLRSLAAAGSVEPGFDVAGVGGARIYLDADAYPGDAEEQAYFRRLLERLEGRSDLLAVGASSGLPMDPETIDYDLPFDLPGEPPGERIRQAFFRIVSPGFHRALGIPLLEGRPFDRRDSPDSEPVALINRSFARLAWRDRSPVGESFLIYDGRRELRVVGVVADVRFSGLTASYKPEFYVPFTQTTYGAMTVVARAADPELAARAIAEEALAVDPSQPVHTTFSLARLTADSIATSRFLAVVLTAFASVSLLLSMAGIYGVLSQWVGESARELGVRVALGSSRPGIVRLVLARTVRLGTAGLALGLVACLALGSLIRGFLFGVSPGDPLSLAAAAAILAVTALTAGLRPALRAANRPAMEALRGE